MPTPDLSLTHEDLLSLSPEELAGQFEDFAEQLDGELARQTFAAAPDLPPVSLDLDADQRAFVHSGAHTMRLLAPAGSGKTHSIVNKVLTLINDGAHASRIVLLTFDNTSRNELQNRVSALFGSTTAPKVSTLNSYGARLLREFKWTTGSPPRLINEAPAYRQKLMAQLLKKLADHNPHIKAVLPEGIKRTYYLELFSLFKNQLYSVRQLTPKQGVVRAWEILRPLLHTSASPLFSKTGTNKQLVITLLAGIDGLYRQYEKEKEQNRYIDFDDQKLLAYELLDTRPDIRSAVQSTLDAVIVDEFQDLNELDFRLILLAAAKSSLIVVGDDDQAIYAFRGTSPKYIIEFEKLSGRQTESMILARNYRCPANIVTHAARLIEHNSYRVPKKPVAARRHKCDIQVHNALTPAAEAKAIASYVQRAHDQGHALKEVAILYRMNAQSLPLQLEFLTKGIPYYCRKEDNIIEHDHLPRVISMLRFTSAFQRRAPVKVDDFLETVRAYFRYFTAEQSEQLRQAAEEADPPFLEALESYRLMNTKIGQSQVADAITDLVQADSPLAAVTTITRRFPGIRGLVGSLEDAVSGDVSLGELGDVAVRFRKIDSFADFLDRAVRKAKDAGTMDLESDSVRLLTYFRSKGTQFDTVILPSVNAGIIPHARAPVDDERRLFYVAVTRTKKNLWLSYVKKACNQKVVPSRFLDELQLSQDCWVGSAGKDFKHGTVHQS